MPGPDRSPETLRGVDRVDRAGVEERMLSTGGGAPPPAGVTRSRTAAGNVVGHVRRPVPGAHREGREAGGRHPPAHAAHARPAHDGSVWCSRWPPPSPSARATCWPGSSWSCWPPCPTCSTAPWPRPSGASSQRGAFFDSVADRVTDMLLFGGVAWYLAADDRGRPGHAAGGRHGAVHAHQLPAGQGRVAGPRGQGRAHGAGRAHHPAVPRACCSPSCSSPSCG